MVRRLLVLFVIAASLPFLAPSAGAESEAGSGDTQLFLVLYADGASLAQGRAAVAAAGGTIRTENAAIGLVEVSSTNPDFLQDVRAQGAVKGAARDQSIATARPGMGRKFADERLEDERAAARPHSGGPSCDRHPAPTRSPATSGTWR